MYSAEPRDSWMKEVYHLINKKVVASLQNLSSKEKIDERRRLEQYYFSCSTKTAIQSMSCRFLSPKHHDWMLVYWPPAAAVLASTAAGAAAALPPPPPLAAQISQHHHQELVVLVLVVMWWWRRINLNGCWSLVPAVKPRLEYRFL